MIDTGAGDDQFFFKTVFSRVEPLATKHFVIGNDHRPRARALEGDTTRQITRERLDALDLLPAAFLIEEILSERDLRHVKLLYGIGGLSYGNVSAPLPSVPLGAIPSSDERERRRQVVTARDRARHPARQRLRRRARRDALERSTRRGASSVSVDAIEHWMIYREHPDVGAILHVHAWIEGTVATEINYPCGTVELAESVAELVRQAPDPHAHGRRAAQPRAHHHRPQPRRDLRAHRRQDRAQGPMD